jgi:hypothetical protein
LAIILREEIYLGTVLQNLKRKWRLSVVVILIGSKTLFSHHFADEQLTIAQDDDDLEYVTRKLQEEYEAWGLSLNLTKAKCPSVDKPGHNLLLEGNSIMKLLIIINSLKCK